MRYGILSSGVLGAVMLAGCGTPPPPVEDHYYRLLLPAAIAAQDTPKLKGTLLIRRLRAEGLLGDRAIAYALAKAPNVLSQYSYHFWSDSPTQLLQDFAADYLRAAGVAAQVLVPELGVDGSHEVIGRIRRFEHLRGKPATVAVSLELTLVEVRGERLLLSKTYDSVQTVQGAGIGPVTKAMNAGVAKIFGRFAEDIMGLQ